MRFLSLFQTDGQNGSYDNRYNGVCIKGGTGTVSATQSEAQTDTEISIMGIKGHRQTDGGGDKLNANPIIPVVIGPVLTICLPVSIYAHIWRYLYLSVCVHFMPIYGDL